MILPSNWYRRNWILNNVSCTLTFIDEFTLTFIWKRTDSPEQQEDTSKPAWDLILRGEPCQVCLEDTIVRWDQFFRVIGAVRVVSSTQSGNSHRAILPLVRPTRGFLNVENSWGNDSPWAVPFGSPSVYYSPHFVYKGSSYVRKGWIMLSPVSQNVDLIVLPNSPTHPPTHSLTHSLSHPLVLHNARRAGGQPWVSSFTFSLS